MSEEQPMNTESPRPHLDVPRPTRRTVSLRTLFPWQLLRFAAINLKMMQMLHKCHNPPPGRKF